MEEILASIRRIIADDQSLPTHASLRAAVESPEPPAPELRHAPVHILHPEPAPVAASSSLADEAHSEVPMEEVGEPPPERSPEPVTTPPEPVVAPRFMPSSRAPDHFDPGPGSVGDGSRRSFLSERAATRLAATVEPPDTDETAPFAYDVPLGQASEPAEATEPAALFSASTDSSLTSAFNLLAATRIADNSDELLAMTREMIRPMLRAWLDDNLPSMVERLVRAEIERVARGR